MPEVYEAQDWIYKIEESFLNLPGADGGDATSVPIAKMIATIGQNQIPMVAVTIDTSKLEAGTPGTPTYPVLDELKPKAPTLESMINLYSEYQAYVNRDDARAELYIKMVSEADEQEIHLIDWWISGVGIENLQASGGFGIVMHLQHPVYEATLASSAVSNTAANTDAPGLLNNAPSDVLEGFLDTVEAYQKKVSSVVLGEPDPAEPSLQSLTDIIAKQAKIATEALRENTKWDKAGGNDLPFAGMGTVGAAVKNYLEHALWAFAATPSLSLWEIFAGSLLQSFELQVNGTLSNEPLIVSPYAAWGKSIATIYDDDIFQISLPRQDGDPIAGILALFSGAKDWEDFGMYQNMVGKETLGAGGSGSAGGGSSGKKKNTINEISDGGGYLEPLQKGLIGKVRSYSAPDWVSRFLKYRSSKGNTYEPGPSDTNQFDQGGKSSNPKAPDYKLYRDMMSNWAKQTFYREYRRTMGLTLGTRLMLTNPELTGLPGTQLRPGVTLEIKPREELQFQEEENPPLIYFFVSEVMHVISAMDSKAYTNIRGAYVRSPVDILPDILTEQIIRDGVENPIYESAGVLTV